MDNSSSNSVTFFRAISKYAIVILELMTEFIKTMFEYFWRSVAFAVDADKHKFNSFCSSVPVTERAVVFSIKVKAANKMVAETGDEGHRLVRVREVQWHVLASTLWVKRCRACPLRTQVLTVQDKLQGRIEDGPVPEVRSAAGQSEAATSASISHYCAWITW